MWRSDVELPHRPQTSVVWLDRIAPASERESERERRMKERDD